jgi:hypothetical protein
MSGGAPTRIFIAGVLGRTRTLHPVDREFPKKKLRGMAGRRTCTNSSEVKQEFWGFETES